MWKKVIEVDRDGFPKARKQVCRIAPPLADSTTGEEGFLIFGGRFTRPEL
jgi:hypothetical protein